MDEIKRLYDKANEFYLKAQGILKEFEGKDSMPQEKSNEVTTLLDQVDALNAQAKQLERALEKKNEIESKQRQIAESSRVPEGSRPGVFHNTEQQPPDEAKAKLMAAQVKYWQTGDDTELKALSVGKLEGGGYLVADTFIDTVLMEQEQTLAMRQICNVLPPVPAGSVVVPTAEPLSDAVNASETNDTNEDTVEPYGGRVLTPHEYDKMIKVSRAFFRNKRFNVETWLRQQGVLACNRREEADYINGNGTGKALGILNTTSLPTWTSAAALTIDGDDIINWVYKLPSSYAANPKTRILSNRAFIRKLRTMKTGLGDYVWQPGLAEGTPNRILGIQYVESDKFDDGLDANDAWEASAKIAVVGDFSYYWILDAEELYVQRFDELYARSKQIGFQWTKATDGMAVLAEAFYALVVHA